MAKIKNLGKTEQPIGWQIVHVETDNPPEGFNTCDVYKQSYVLAWLQAHNPTQWRLLPIFKGSVEAPNMVALDLPAEPKEKWFIVRRQERYEQRVAVKALTAQQAIDKVAQDDDCTEYFPPEYVETLDPINWDAGMVVDADEVSRIEQYVDGNDEYRQHIHKKAGVY
jgi:hypothetical protein